MTDIDPYQDIRPYHDHEIRPVLDRLLDTPEFISSIAGFAYPRVSRFMPGILNALTRRRLRSQLRSVNDVAAMQDVIAGYMDKMIERTTTGLTHSGLDALPKGQSFLFISNHRDIAMDPAFVNYMLYHSGHDTLYIAIGDNLLKRPFVTDLMRLNKSFIVRRSLKGRELLKSSKLLSEYIDYLVGLQNNVWIAQREGRAKDGIDRTDTALLKMLGMARKKEGLPAALNALNIVPVSISYELDPCDELKAVELQQKDEHGFFEKDEKSDIHSIVTGMVGNKGRVHVAFGELLKFDPGADDEDIAQLIDQQVVSHYRIQSSNVLAVRMLAEQSGDIMSKLSDEGQQYIQGYSPDVGLTDSFRARIEAMPAKAQPYALQMYANPVISRFPA